MANLVIAANISSNNTAYSESGAAWIVISSANDKLIFSSGSDTVADGLAIPSQSEYNRAGVVLTGSQQVVSQYFLEDASAGILRRIQLMGNTTSRYVLAFDFDASTATEPVLELWDDSNLNTVTGTTLGAGTPSSSWWKGIVTTTSTPGSNWTGVSLAGSSTNHFLNLNDGSGALATADTLYCNLKIVIPASAASGVNTTPVFAVKFASN